MKYKVGDKVRVRDDLEINKFYGNGYRFTPHMARYKGQVVTISRVGNDFYKIKDDIYYWSWTDNMFEDAMKYKVGDKVRVKKGLIDGEKYGNVRYVDNMDKWADKIVTISRVRNGYYEILEDKDKGKWAWSDEMFTDEPRDTKYKVGDKVRVREDLVHGEVYGGMSFYMDSWKGKVVTIASISRLGDYYKVEGDKDGWAWSDEMFEDVSEIPTDGKVQTVDVGYYLAFCGHGVLVDVYQDGSHDSNSFFTSADGFNRYILPRDAIKWVIPHEREIDL